MFKKIIFYDGQEPEGWQPFLKKLSKDNAKGILLFVGEETPFDYKQLQPLLKTMDIEVWGGIFPEVIYNGSLYKQGVVGCAFQSPVSIEVIKDLCKFNGNFPEDFVSKNTRTLLIFTSAYADNIPLLIETLYEKYFKEMAFVGGSAGSIIDIDQPSLFTCDDIFAGGAIIAAVEDFMSVGINHGCQPISEPAIASSVDKNIIKSINWEPAFEYYKRIIEQDTGIKLTADDFLDVAKSYPFRILKYDTEIVLRVPISVGEENSLLFASEMPENSVLVITKGYPDKLITAAGTAAEQAKIASTGDKYIELYNKTIVIGMGE